MKIKEERRTVYIIAKPDVNQGYKILNWLTADIVQTNYTFLIYFTITNSISPLKRPAEEFSHRLCHFPIENLLSSFRKILCCASEICPLASYIFENSCAVMSKGTMPAITQHASRDIVRYRCKYFKQARSSTGLRRHNKELCTDDWTIEQGSTRNKGIGKRNGSESPDSFILLKAQLSLPLTIFEIFHQILIQFWPHIH
ncbi:hypothetical protein FF38_03057 [Lucilia cuprina]|uniref:Uncharacterized protein n=1 Tax=Lucilia cuprina TaxID=7375 RepID=A0A0L0CEW2_LUCCU|nr:hypothetical protein FF38_03057 [Lucilia cuprina]